MSVPSADPIPSQVRVAGLFVYPVKSCAGIALDEWLLTEDGLDLDRAWMVVDAADQFVSQREQPRLALVQPQFKRGGTELVLRAPGMLALHLAVDVVEEPRQVQLWGETLQAYDMGDLAAQWFTDFLSLTEQGLPGASPARLRLVRFDPEQRRLSDRRWTGAIEASTQFSDGFALLVLGQASLEGLNARLEQQGAPRVTVERFRPNLLLEGLPAHGEDHLQDLRIETEQGEVRIRLVKPCARCQIPDVDPATAECGTSVGEALRAYRQDARLDGALSFGMNAIVVEGAGHVLRRGQWVRLQDDQE